MDITRKASAGTVQSSDLMVFVEPASTLEVDIESTVKQQFEGLIRERVMANLARLGVSHGRLRISDRGALDYAIDARIETALRRAAVKMETSEVVP
ncbi:MAG: citrate lyase acyl carrier protein [Deltaproteobacteria bacterium]|nr:citrate lyase acyl carrier protein [Deltaproteobacteria bacterium]